MTRAHLAPRVFDGPQMDPAPTVAQVMEAQKQGLAISKAELWILSYYRTSEIGGALLFGRLARRMKDETLRILLTRHFADESRHAWLWTNTIMQVGGTPIQMDDTYQARYHAEVGLPSTPLELMAITQVFERRVINQYKTHQNRKTTHPAVRDTFDLIMKDELWHLSWVDDELKQLARTEGKSTVEDTVRHFRDIDRRVYADVAKYEKEPWKIFGLEAP